MKILKILLILAVGTASIFSAVHFTEKYAAEVTAKENTLAEALLKSQLEAELKKAEKQAADKLGEALVTTVIETIAPETQLSVTETSAAETSVTSFTEITEDVSEENIAETEEEIITEFTRGGILPIDRTNISVRSMFALTASEHERLTYFLIDFYFLDGEIYVKNELRPQLKEKKQLANKMEKSAISALNLVLENVSLSDITTIMSADYSKLKKEITAIRDEFEREYSNASDYGDEFKAMYDNSLRYLNRLIEAIGRLESTAYEYANSANPLLAAVVVARAAEDVIIPEIMSVLEQSFDLVETSQDIFLEGTQGKQLLTRQEVTEIIINPALVLDTGLA